MFDKDFILTIPRAKPKFDVTMNHLESVGLKPEPFRGLDCDITGLETSFVYELDNPGSGYRIARKHVSMNLSHYMLWKVCSYLQHDSFMVFEDDVRMSLDWKTHMDEAKKYLPADWDLLYVGNCCCAGGKNKHLGGRLFKTTYALCTHAYAIRQKALPVLLEKCEKIWTCIDISLALQAFPHLNCYVMLPTLATQHETVLSP